MNVQPTQLSDLVISSLASEKVESIVSLAQQDTSLSGEALLLSLVYSGVALGVDEAQTFLTNHMQELLPGLRGVVSMIDADLGMSTDAEMAEALTAIRAPVADMLRSRIAIMTAAYINHVESTFGVPEKCITAADWRKDTPREEILSIATAFFVRNPAAVLGWYQTVNDASAPKMACRCPGCYANTFSKQENPSASRAIQRIVSGGGTLDAALLGYGVYLIDNLREQIESIAEGGSGLHEIDERASEKVSEDFITRLRKNAR